MRYLFLLVLILFQLEAQEEKFPLTIGLGAYIESQPYKGVKSHILPSPIVFYDNKVFYARWSRIGLYFLGNSYNNYSWAFSVTAQPRPNNYQNTDSDILIGMNNKKSSLEAGLAFSATFNDAYIESMFLHDILNRYNSWLLKTEIGYKYKLGKFKFYPSLIFIYHSSKFLNYYYGVSHNEAITSNNKEYHLNNSLEFGLQTYIKYPLTSELSALFNIRIDSLAKEVINSPIIEDKYIHSELLSLIYTF